MNTTSKNRITRSLILAAYIIAVSILVLLGTWQCIRGLHKADLEQRIGAYADIAMNLQTAPEAWEELNYRQVTLIGKPLLSKTMLLDNRIHQGRVGYEVIVPFDLLDASTTILVNRGWVSREQASLLEHIENTDEIEVSGQLYHPDAGIMLVETVVTKGQWPEIIAYLDIPSLADALGIALAPAVLVLDTNSIYGFQRIWQPFIMTPTRHYGYALQWWGLAAVLLVFGWIWKFRRNAENHE